jgi:hypothetical protein
MALGLFRSFWPMKLAFVMDDRLGCTHLEMSRVSELNIGVLWFERIQE